jgi:hypothetical protein
MINLSLYNLKMPLKKIKMLFKMTDREIHAEFAFATFGFGSTCVLPANA